MDFHLYFSIPNRVKISEHRSMKQFILGIEKLTIEIRSLFLSRRCFINNLEIIDLHHSLIAFVNKRNSVDHVAKWWKIKETQTY